MAIFGYSSIGGSTQAIAAVTKRFWKFTTPASVGPVVSISAYCNRSASGSGYAVDAAIYTDNAGAPNGLVANSSIQLSSNIARNSPAWYPASYGTPPTLSPNTTYWIGVLFTKAGVTYHTSGGANQEASRADTLPFDDPFGGSPTYANNQGSCYVVLGTAVAADKGTFSESGKAATPRVARKVAADVTPFSETLVATNVGKVARKLSSAQGIFELTGNDVILSRGRTCAAALGTFTLTGNDATLSEGGAPEPVDFGNVTVLTTDGTSYTSDAFTPEARDHIIVFVGAFDCVAASPTMTDTQTLAFVLRDKITKGNHTLYVFEALKPAAASSMTVTFDCTGDAASGCWIATYCFHLGAYIKQTKTASGNAAASPAVVFDAAPASSSTVLGAVLNSTNPATLTEPTEFTEDADTGYSE